MIINELQYSKIYIKINLMAQEEEKKKPIDTKSVIGLQESQYVYLTKEQLKETPVLGLNINECVFVVIQFNNGDVFAYHNLYKDHLNTLIEILKSKMNEMKLQFDDIKVINLYGGNINNRVTPKNDDLIYTNGESIKYSHKGTLDVALHSEVPSDDLENRFSLIKEKNKILTTEETNEVREQFMKDIPTLFKDIQIPLRVNSYYFNSNNDLDAPDDKQYYFYVQDIRNFIGERNLSGIYSVLKSVFGEEVYTKIIHQYTSSNANIKISWDRMSELVESTKINICQMKLNKVRSQDIGSHDSKNSVLEEEMRNVSLKEMLTSLEEMEPNDKKI